MIKQIQKLLSAGTIKSVNLTLSMKDDVMTAMVSILPSNPTAGEIYKPVVFSAPAEEMERDLGPAVLLMTGTRLGLIEQANQAAQAEKDAAAAKIAAKQTGKKVAAAPAPVPAAPVAAFGAAAPAAVSKPAASNAKDDVDESDDDSGDESEESQGSPASEHAMFGSAPAAAASTTPSSSSDVDDLFGS